MNLAPCMCHLYGYKIAHYTVLYLADHYSFSKKIMKCCQVSHGTYIYGPLKNITDKLIKIKTKTKTTVIKNETNMIKM